MYYLQIMINWCIFSFQSLCLCLSASVSQSPIPSLQRPSQGCLRDMEATKHGLDVAQQGKGTLEIPISGAVVLEGVPLGSAAKPTLPGGASTLAVIVPPGKLGSLSGAEADADYERVAIQVAAQRAKEMAAVDEEISKRESAIEVAAARRPFERLERERVATANFNVEMKRRQERLDELDRENARPPPACE